MFMHLSFPFIGIVPSKSLQLLHYILTRCKFSGLGRGCIPSLTFSLPRGSPLTSKNRLALGTVKSISGQSAHSAVKGLIKNVVFSISREFSA